MLRPTGGFRRIKNLLSDIKNRLSRLSWIKIFLIHTKYSLIEYDNNLPQFVLEIFNAKLVNWKCYNQNLISYDNNINENDISQIKNIFIHINNIDSNLIDNDELHELNQFNVITDLYKLKYFEHIHKYTNTYSVY